MNESTAYGFFGFGSGILSQIGAYIPKFFGGLLILAIGLIIAALIQKIVVEFFRLLKVERWFEEARIAKASTVKVWPNIIGELVRWTIIILFLVPTADAWGIPRVTSLLSQLLLYIPNVFVSVIVTLIGIVIANIVHDIVENGVRGLGSKSAKAIASIARYSIIFFTALVVLNQLGVASDLIRILFTGIIAMLALAGGLAFGLGGQDTARDILKGLRQRLEEK